MNRFTKIAKKIAAGDVLVEVFPKYVRCTVFTSMESNDLRVYERELSVAESNVSREAVKAIVELEKLGRRGRKLNVGITPSKGIVGVVVEFDKEMDSDTMSDFQTVMGN